MESKSLLIYVVVTVLLLLPVVTAYELNDYPTPFRRNAFLGDTVMVVGQHAAAEDISSAKAIAGALEEESLDLLASVNPPVIDSGKAIGKGNRKFFYGDSIQNVHSSAFTSTDLPQVLADSTLKTASKTVTYKQDIRFAAGNAEFLFTKPKDQPAGNYLKLSKDTLLYTYSLRFNNPLSYTDASRLQGKTLHIQGKDYTIRKAEVVTGSLNSLILSTDNRRVWLSENEPYRYDTHTIKVVGAGVTRQRCAVSVDGTSKWIDHNKKADINGLAITVLDSTSTRKGDSCELSLGGTEIVLKHDAKVTIRNTPLRGAQATFLGSPGSWKGLSVEYTSGKESAGINSKDIYLSTGDAWSDPVFSSWKLSYEGVSADFEPLMLKQTKEATLLRYSSAKGYAVEIPFSIDTSTSTVKLGTQKKPLLLAGESYEGTLKGLTLLYIGSSGESRLLELRDVNCDSKKISIRDTTQQKTVVDSRTIACNGQETINLGGLGSITLDLSPNSLTYSPLTNTVAKTSYGGTLTFSKNSFTFKENNAGKQPSSTITVQLTPDNTRIIPKTTINDETVEWIKGDKKDTSKLSTTARGTLVKYNEKQPFIVEILEPQSDVIANVFLSSVSSLVTPGTGNNLENTLLHIPLLPDINATTSKKHMIVVGGPCANTFAAELLGTQDDCEDGFEPGKGRLQLFERPNQVILLVAGYYAADTQATADVLTDYSAHPLFSTRMVVEHANGKSVVNIE